MNKPVPCRRDPDLFFAGHAECPDQPPGGPSMEKLRRASDQSALARTMCLRECPLAQQRICAQSALDNGEEWGVWAGVQLSGGQSRKKPELAEKREILRRIAVGEINSRQLYDNAALLAKTEDATPLIRRPGWIPLPDTATATADIA